MMMVFLMAGCLECRIPPSSWRVIGVPSSWWILWICCVISSVGV